MFEFYRRLRWAVIAVALCAAIPAGTVYAQGGAPRTLQQLESAIGAVLAQPAFDNAFWGAYVLDPETGRVLYDHNAGKSFVPASNMKLYTSATALSLLGSDYRYTTGLYADGPIQDGVLEGNLIVRGAGDPSLIDTFHSGDPLRVLQAWADTLKMMGIARVEGDVIGDDDVFDDVPLGTGWDWEDEVYGYAAEISGLSFNRNVVNVEIRSTRAGQPGAVTWEPFDTPYVEVVNETETIPTGRIREGYERERATNRVRLYSLVPAGRIDSEAIAIHNPTLYFAHTLREVLEREGIDVAGRAVDVDQLREDPEYRSDAVRRLAVYVSPPLSKIVWELNKESDNHIAEQLLKTLAAERSPARSVPNGASARVGARLVKQMLAGIEVDTTDLVIADGSGLSRRNLITPEATGALLRHMWNHPDETVREAFIASLPVGGEDGTLERRFRSGPAEGNVRAKTGTLTGAASLAGYVRSGGGTPLVFVLMANPYTTRTATVREAQDRIVNLLATYRR